MGSAREGGGSASGESHTITHELGSETRLGKVWGASGNERLSSMAANDFVIDPAEEIRAGVSQPPATAATTITTTTTSTVSKDNVGEVPLLLDLRRGMELYVVVDGKQKKLVLENNNNSDDVISFDEFKQQYPQFVANYVQVLTYIIKNIIEGAVVKKDTGESGYQVFAPDVRIRLCKHNEDSNVLEFEITQVKAHIQFVSREVVKLTYDKPITLKGEMKEGKFHLQQLVMQSPRLVFGNVETLMQNVLIHGEDDVSTLLPQHQGATGPTHNARRNYEKNKLKFTQYYIDQDKYDEDFVELANNILNFANAEFAKQPGDVEMLRQINQIIVSLNRNKSPDFALLQEKYFDMYAKKLAIKYKGNQPGDAIAETSRKILQIAILEANESKAKQDKKLNESKAKQDKELLKKIQKLKKLTKLLETLDKISNDPMNEKAIEELIVCLKDLESQKWGRRIAGAGAVLAGGLVTGAALFVAGVAVGVTAPITIAGVTIGGLATTGTGVTLGAAGASATAAAATVGGGMYGMFADSESNKLLKQGRKSVTQHAKSGSASSAANSSAAGGAAAGGDLSDDDFFDLGRGAADVDSDDTRPSSTRSSRKQG